MKSCFIKESKNGLKILFDLVLTLVIIFWPVIVGFYIILYILNPFHNPTTIEQALKSFYWNQSTGMLYSFVVAGFTVVYDIVIGLPLTDCYLSGDN